MDSWHSCCWHKIFSILVIKQFSYHCVDIMDIIYYLCSCDGFVHNNAFKDKQKGKIYYAKYFDNFKQQQLKYFWIESYSQNWQTADSHERYWPIKKEKHYFPFYFLQFICMSNCLPVESCRDLTVRYFLASLFYQNVKCWLQCLELFQSKFCYE